MSDEEPTLIGRLRDQLDQPGPLSPVPATVALRRALGGAVPGGAQPWSPQTVRREVARPFTYGVRETPGTSQECLESVTGHSVGGSTDGTCTWCGAQVDGRPARPGLPSGYRTELDLEYRRHYDPDWGSDAYDV